MEGEMKKGKETEGEEEMEKGLEERITKNDGLG